MKNQIKTYIFDKEQALGISAIAFGISALFVSGCVMVSVLTDDMAERLVERTIPMTALLLFGLGMVIMGIYKLTVYSRVKSETEDLMRFGVKCEGTVVGIDMAGNRRARNDAVIVRCLVTDPQTGAERWYTSRSVIGNAQTIAGKVVDIYVYPGDENNYYVDLKSARYIAPEGVTRVHDFR